MKTKVVLLVIALALLSACATTRLKTAGQVYADAQEAWLNMWDSYHKVYLVQPPEVKKVWEKKYHPKFKLAGEAIVKFQLQPGVSVQQAMDKALTVCEDILVELMIQSKGGVK